MWFSKSKAAPAPEAPFFAWSDEVHSVGISVFDREHERLAILMSQVHTALQAKHDRQLAQNLMESLIYETQAHFDHEEGVMRDLGFQDREAHAAEHAALIQQAKAMLQKVQTGGISALTLPSFLKTWLIAHMQNTDRKYAAILRLHGLR